MKLNRLGASDLSVSRVGLGCNNFGRRLDLAGTRAVVEAALDAGITFFDTADTYGNGDSERFLGEVLAGKREGVVIATKFGNDMGDGYAGPRGSRAYVLRSIDASLERLRTDYVDLYYYHRPDGVTPLAETVGALHELVDAGKVRWIGCSNLNAEQLLEVVELFPPGESRFIALQNQYSLLERDAERDVLPACRQHGVSFVPYFPLASGLLTGKYRRREPAPAGSRLEGRASALDDSVLRGVEELEALAAAWGMTLLELAIGALASQEGIDSVIAGATTAEQVQANAAAGEAEVSDSSQIPLVASG